MQVANRYEVGKRGNGWFKAVFLVLAWLLIVSLVRDVWEIRGGFGRVKDSEQRLASEEKKNEDLKKKYSLVQTEEYRERLIREKLNMQKEGEVLVVLPGKEEGVLEPNELPEMEIENWQKWFKILY